MMLSTSPPRLAIPASTAGSPSAHSTTTQTGRPSMWTKSAQRKMTRLYVYTTLPLNKIVELVHCRTPDSAPGHESAHKKLNVLLDKEPRWLHPRSDSDMGRRVNELANSPTRLRSASNATLGCSPFTSNDSTVSPSSQTAGMGDDDSPASLAAPPTAPGRTISFNPSDHVWAEETTDAHGFSSFLRRTTCLSNSTNHTTGSFHRVLSNYSEPYVQTVKRLVKRFTAPIANRASLSPSFSEASGAADPCFSGQGYPPPVHAQPLHLPGDYLLSPDEFSNNSTQCYATHDAHSYQRCLCFTDLDPCLLPWVDRDGLTSAGRRILTSGPTQDDASRTDAFGNTVLHLLAARASIEVLSHWLRIDYCRPSIEAKNTAGQTFLHVLCRRILVGNPDSVCSLLAMISEKSPGLIHSRDCYGRSFPHLLGAEPHCRELLDRVATFCDQDVFAARDAFGFSPAYHAAATGMDLDQDGLAWQSSSSWIATPNLGIVMESRLLENVRLAGQFPSWQDDHGRNGLHCLAMASLSFATVASKYHVQAASREKVTKKHQNPQHALDSSTDKLNFRLGLLIGLLDAGVDPNQHDDDGNTPLMTFVAELPEDDDYKVPPKILEALVSRGANVHARNRQGETALHIAVQCGRKLATRTLIRLGASVHVRDAAGRSLLDVADVKMMNCKSDERLADYAHYEACRAWLSGQAMAVQRPTVLDEWGKGSVARDILRR
ncbi:hypothetical protein E4U41_000714 [Claviceps citrina]|nr:hypothetical protein E4U41_000714 [Claviceps citrina]